MKNSFSSDLETDWLSGNVTIGSTDTMSSYYSTSPYTNITLNSTGSANTAFGYTTSGSNGSWGPVSVALSSKVEVNGSDADVVINGKSLTKFMETMESRLAILQPDLEKLEHFSALKKAYDHYKAMEALCELPKKEDGNT